MRHLARVPRPAFHNWNELKVSQPQAGQVILHAHRMLDVPPVYCHQGIMLHAMFAQRLDAFDDPRMAQSTTFVAPIFVVQLRRSIDADTHEKRVSGRNSAQWSSIKIAFV